MRFRVTSYTIGDSVTRWRDETLVDDIRDAAEWTRLAFESGADKVELLDNERLGT